MIYKDYIFKQKTNSLHDNNSKLLESDKAKYSILLF